MKFIFHPVSQCCLLSGATETSQSLRNPVAFSGLTCSYLRRSISIMCIWFFASVWVFPSWERGGFPSKTARFFCFTNAQNGINLTVTSKLDLFDLIWFSSICSSPCLCLIVCLPPLNCFYAFRCRNKSQKSKFDEELHNEMTTTIDELSSK